MQSKRQEKQSLVNGYHTEYCVVTVNIYVSANNQVNHSHKKLGKLLCCYFWRNKNIEKVISLNRLFISINISLREYLRKQNDDARLTQTSFLKGLEITNPCKGDKNIVSGNTRFSPPEGAAEHSA